MNFVYESAVTFMHVPEYERFDLIGLSSGGTLVSSEGVVLNEKTTFNYSHYTFDRIAIVLLKPIDTRRKGII